MKIELHPSINPKIIQQQLQTAEITDDGEFLLIPKRNFKLAGFHRGEVYYFPLEDILYIETCSDGNVQIVLEDCIYTSRLRLKDFLQLSDNFIQINISVIVNTRYIKRIKPKINMKFEVLINNQWLDVNRTYYYIFKETLKL